MDESLAVEDIARRIKTRLTANPRQKSVLLHLQMPLSNTIMGYDERTKMMVTITLEVKPYG